MISSIFNFKRVNDCLSPGVVWGVWLCLMISLVFATEHFLSIVFERPTPQAVEAKRFSGATELVFLGTSRTQVNIDPLAFNRPTINVSEAGLTYVIMEKIWASILKRQQGIKLLVLEYSAEALAYSFDQIPHKFERAFAPFGLEPVNGFTRGATTPEVFFARWFPNIFAFRLTPRQILADAKALHLNQEVTSGHRPIDRALDIDQAHVSLKNFVNFIESNRESNGTNANQTAFHKIIQQATQQGIQVVLLRHPVHPLYFEKVPTDWEKILNSAIGEVQANQSKVIVQVHDLARIYFDHFEYFADFDHLNRKGAQAFSMELRTRTENLLNTSP